MKRIHKTLLTAALCAGSLLPLHAQEAVQRILDQIETNNREIRAAVGTTTAQKLENRAANNLPNPSLSYSHLWDSDDKNITVGELVISQGFDFPTLYASRAKQNRVKAQSLDLQAAAVRQDVLIRAKELCIDIIWLYQTQQLLDERLRNAEALAKLYDERRQMGAVNSLEANKINLELLNVRTEARLNASSLQTKLQELQAMNGGKSLAPGRPLPEPQVPGAQALGLVEYLPCPLPTAEEFANSCTPLLEDDPALGTLGMEREAASKQVGISRQGWLPKLEVGYRRNTETRHPLNGIVVGFSFPLFENRHKVKAAKAQLAGAEYLEQQAFIDASSRLWQLYEEAARLHASIEEYQETFARQRDLTLLRKALDGGEISLIEYFVEVSVVYQSQQNLLQLENQYQKTMAQIFKSQL